MRIVIVVSVLGIVGLGVFGTLGYYIAKDFFDDSKSALCEVNRDDCNKVRASVKTAYDEGKDLSKAFLTLLVAVFVASITFSEKIIDLKTAGPWAKTAMIACWVSLLLAIIACGTGLVYLASALAQLTFKDLIAIHHILAGGGLIGSSGLLFVVGLIMMLLAGMPGFLRKPN